MATHLGCEDIGLIEQLVLLVWKHGSKALVSGLFPVAFMGAGSDLGPVVLSMIETLHDFRYPNPGIMVVLCVLGHAGFTSSTVSPHCMSVGSLLGMWHPFGSRFQVWGSLKKTRSGYLRPWEARRLSWPQEQSKVPVSRNLEASTSRLGLRGAFGAPSLTESPIWLD